MKIVVIAGTGLIGSKLVALLRQRGQDVLAASSDSGVNTLTGQGLPEALAGAQVVVDVANSPSFEDDAVMNFFAQDEGVDARRAQLIWDGVAANSTPSIGLHKENEVSLCTAGIALDWGGFGYESLPALQIAEIVDAFPLLEMKEQFTNAVCWIVETRPTTTYDNFASDFGQRFVPGHKRPSAVDFLLGAPFKE